MLERLNALEDPDRPPEPGLGRRARPARRRRPAREIRLEFQPATWHAFEETVRKGREAAVVAADLGMTVNAVLIAKSRVS